ncbi:DNA binding domain-containing protein, excisionase family [Paenibacillus sp. yr247]|uniref:helix-turn-helix domain-containing protein n=1 Tax=Paenibacillus sp. yr247 TaxID=1761880 RepID=UPI00088ABF77|nr:DNA binding domain-containing protein, excisionase family [Paenibacillus sp. yr247]
MREYVLMRINLLKRLLELEEKLMVESDEENQQNKVVSYGTPTEVNVHRQESGQLKAVFSVVELSSYLGVSTDCIYTMVRENQVPYVRIRRRILFHREAINSWLENPSSKQ